MGKYDTEEQAARNYNIHAIEMFDDRAILNKFEDDEDEYTEVDESDVEYIEE